MQMGIEKLINEEWESVVGWEGFYEVSNYGRIKSLSRIAKGSWKHKNRVLKERIMKQQTNGLGRPTVDLSDGERSKTLQVPLLVAKAFIPNPDNKPQLNHIDGNPANNHISNLEWVTRSENMKHAWENGLRQHYTTKLSDNDIKKMRIYREFGCPVIFIADIFNCSQTYVSNIVNGKFKTNVPNDLEYRIHNKD